MDYFRFPQGAEAWECHREWVTRVQPKFGPAVGPRFAWAATVAPQDVARARARREEISQRMDEMLRGDAVLALPSISGIAPLRGSPPEVIDEVRRRALPCCAFGPRASAAGVAAARDGGWLSAGAFPHCLRVAMTRCCSISPRS
jgi:amidase